MAGPGASRWVVSTEGSGPVGGALKKAIYNYMHGIGLEEDVRSWFLFKVPKTNVARNRIERALRERD